MTQLKSKIIQYNEYYPFGLQASTSWTRENNSNNYLYNAANELNQNTGWYEMFYRGYDPALGRMLQVDPYATMYSPHTPYNFALNTPNLLNDPTGGYVYANAAADRIDKINSRNDPNYFDRWSETFKTPGMILLDDANAVRSGQMSFEAYAAKYGPDPSTREQFVEMLYGAIDWTGNPDPNDYVPGGTSKNMFTTLMESAGVIVDKTSVEQISNRYAFIERLLDSSRPNDIDIWSAVGHSVGPVLFLAGQRFNVFKPKAYLRAPSGSSAASALVRKASWNKKALTGTIGKTVGRALSTGTMGAAVGRLVPIVGFVWTMADISINVIFPATQAFKDYQRQNKESGNWIANLPH